MHFLSPYWLFMLIGVGAAAVAYVLLQFRRKKYVARFSNAALLASIVPRRPGWRRHLTFALLLIAMTVLSLGVARPATKVRVPQERATVMLAIDVSLSMQATDVLPDRIEAAKKAAATFADVLPKKINLGLVKFGGHAAVLVPPTLDREAFKLAVSNLKLEESTAIGEAVFTCLDAIQSFSQSTTAPGDKPPPARIVLMSDGFNTAGRRVSDAAAASKKANTPVSTIAFGTDGGSVDVQGQRIPVPADKPTLRGLAQSTGGTFHTAASVEELQSVYRDLGSQIGYTKKDKDISWRFLLFGTMLAIAASATSLLWSGRLA